MLSLQVVTNIQVFKHFGKTSGHCEFCTGVEGAGEVEADEGEDSGKDDAGEEDAGAAIGADDDCGATGGATGGLQSKSTP